MAVTNRENLVLRGVNVAGDVVTGLKRIGFRAAMEQNPAMDLSHSRHVLASRSSATTAEQAVLSGRSPVQGEAWPTAACGAVRLTAGLQATMHQVLPERFQPCAAPTSYRGGLKTRPDSRGGNDRQGPAAWSRPLQGTLPASMRG
jgi:hypothetical protein